MLAQATAKAAAACTGAAAPIFHTSTRNVVSTATPALRMTSSGVQATIFGATGFVGKYLTYRLASQGIVTILPFRGDDMDTRHLRRMGDLGVAVPVPFSSRNDDSIKRAVENSDIVINLIGKDNETDSLPWKTNCSYEEVHIDVAAKIARLSAEAGASTLVHLSALAADEHSISRWARSKALGEQAVRAETPGATIVRPADVFGAQDKFLSLFAFMARALPRLPLVDGGHARVQPLFVQDLAYALERIALSTQPDIALAQTYELAGPDVYTHREIAEFVFEATGNKDPSVVNVNSTLADIFGAALGVFPDSTLCRDRFLRMQIDNVLNVNSATKRLADVELEATSMELPGFQFLAVDKRGDNFDAIDNDDVVQFRERNFQ